jgi:hypothetical protein
MQGQRDVIVLATEDALNYTIRPRFGAAGADLTKVHSVEFSDPGKGLSLLDDAQALEAKIVEKQAALVIIDPLSDYLSNVNTWRDNELRQALRPFGAIACKHRVATVAIMHITKAEDRAALHRILGSVAFTGLVRYAFIVADDREDDTRRLFLPVKHNLGPRPDGMAYRVVGDWIPDPQGGPRIPVGKIAWLPQEPVSVSADEALRSPGDGVRSSVKAETLLKQLTAQGPVRSKMIYQHCAKEHISKRTIKEVKNKEVKKRLRVLTRKVGTRWYCLPPSWTTDQADGWKPGAKGRPHTQRAPGTDPGPMTPRNEGCKPGTVAPLHPSFPRSLDLYILSLLHSCMGARVQVGQGCPFFPP